MKVTINATNHQYKHYLGKKNLLKDKSTGSYDIFMAHNNHASCGLKWKNDHLEFVCAVN